MNYKKLIIKEHLYLLGDIEKSIQREAFLGLNIDSDINSIGDVRKAESSSSRFDEFQMPLKYKGIFTLDTGEEVLVLKIPSSGVIPTTNFLYKIYFIDKTGDELYIPWLKPQSIRIYKAIFNKINDVTNQKRLQLNANTQ